MKNLDLKEKAYQLNNDIKVWFGETSEKINHSLEDANDKLVDFIQKTNDSTEEFAKKEAEKFETARTHFKEQNEEFKAKALANWDKLTHLDLEETKESFEAFTTRIKEKYNHSKEEAETQFKEFMSKFEY